MTNKKPVLARAINWNRIEDPLDKIVWDKLVSQFWIDTAFPLSNDLASWHTLSDAEKLLTMRVFTGLTLLDTVQSDFGADALKADAITPHEREVYGQIGHMESIHAKSYSSVFSTLCTSEQIDDVFRWSEENPFLQKKAEIVLSYYQGEDPLKKKIASTLLESFLFYSGFYLPIYWSARQKLTNTSDMVRFIIRDEAVHGFYIGYKFQKGFEKLDADAQEELTDWTMDLLMELYDNEIAYTEDLYDEIGLTEEVKVFLQYNANKALQNLGFDPLFPVTAADVNPVIMSSLSLETETQDFFSSTGAYSKAVVEEVQDKDLLSGYDDSAIVGESFDLDGDCDVSEYLDAPRRKSVHRSERLRTRTTSVSSTVAPVAALDVAESDRPLVSADAEGFTF